MPVSADNAGFAVYVHWPFCRQKCPYCDFNSHVREQIDEARWARALTAEVDRMQVALGDRVVTSVFFGGGTPSLMAPATVEAVLRAIENRWDIAGDVEITLEANPTSVEASRFADLRAAGVNRVSLGVQALNDADLKALGRGHNVDEALAAVVLAQQHFPRSSFDLIYAREGQSVDAWRGELAEALRRARGHLSLYQLTIEPGTAFHQKQQRGQLAIPDEDTQAALWDVTQELTEAARLPGYEVSNHAAPGEESRHNLTYWRYGEYAGIGPGAHGRVKLEDIRFATTAIRAPEAWLAAVEQRGNGEEEPDALDPSIQAGEMLMMGLRTSEGVSRRAFRTVAGCELEHVIEPKRLKALESDGFVVLDALSLRVTPVGRRVLNAVLRQLLP
jgi:putative oxygen-independent coproporphyrinogen III oxidase